MCDKNNNDIMLSQEILNIRRTISQQYYFLHNDILYIPNDGLVMGAPTLYFFFV